MERFEEGILGGVLYSNLNEAADRRRIWNTVFNEEVNCDRCRVLACKRGTANSSKIVLIFDKQENRNRFVSYLDKCQIAFYGGYSIPDKARVLKNIRQIEGKIIELPIDERDDKMQYMLNCIKIYEFMNHNIDAEDG